MAIKIKGSVVINDSSNLTNLGNSSASLSMAGSSLKLTIGGTDQNTQELNDTHTHDTRYYTESEIDSKVSTLNTSIDGKSAKFGSYPKNDGSGSMSMAIGALARRSGWYDGGLPACNSERAGLLMLYSEGFNDPLHLVVCTPNAWYVIGPATGMCNTFSPTGWTGTCHANNSYYGMTIKGD